MQLIRSFLKIMLVLILLSSCLTGAISYLGRMKPIINKTLEIPFSDYYCIYVKDTETSGNVFSELPEAETVECWEVKYKTNILQTKKLDPGIYRFNELKSGFQYSYQSSQAFFLKWYTFVSLFASFWILKLLKNLKNYQNDFHSS